MYGITYIRYMKGTIMAQNELTERNKKIYKLKVEEGKTYRELSIKFDLSIKRLQDIVNRERERKEAKNAQ